ncbi:MAG: hypothetical protein H0W37_10320 [Pseudonocardiales bacterium]|nr:hypothetical protein [Pseudonocardiales bacterium]
MPGERSLLRLLASAVPGVVRWAEGVLAAPGRSVTLPVCDADREGAQTWVRGGVGASSTLYWCAKNAADVYAWVNPQDRGLFVSWAQRQPGLTLTTYEWTNMPNVATGLYGTSQYQIYVDLTGLSEVRIAAGVAQAGAAAAVLYLQYSTDHGVSYADLTTGRAEAVPLTVGFPSGAWTPIVTAARTDVRLQPTGRGGDGVADPRLHSITAQFR